MIMTTKLYKLHYNFDWDKLKPVCEELVNIEKAQMNLVRNGKTSYVNEIHPHTMDEFKPFYDWLSISMGNEFFIGNSWVNVHHPGGSTIAHDHPNVSMVSAAYLSIPNNSGYFEYKDVTWKELPTVSGDVIIFPGWIEHRTQINNSSEDRWVITTNFIAK